MGDFMQNPKLVASVLAAFALSAASAHAAGVLDQEALPFGGSVYEGLEWQQQVTAGVTGQLTGITLYGAGTDLTVRVATGGAFNPGPYAFTGAAHLTTGGTFIDLTSANINLTAGQAFVIDTLNGSNGNISLAVAPYAGGHLYANFGVPVDYSACCAITAMAFRSFMQAPGGGGAVPEPASWALMILGFGGAGAAFRRKAGVIAAA
jgi:hypothetical protein